MRKHALACVLALACILASLPAQAYGLPRGFVAGRLKCAVNVNAALAARGIRGTGSAMAKSFLAWGRSCSCTTPGAVAVYNRGGKAGNGHVTLIADTSGNVWNPGRRGWQFGRYHKRPIACRCA